jgi:hypothetical protein
VADTYQDVVLTDDCTVWSQAVSLPKMHLRLSLQGDVVWRDQQTDLIWLNGAKLNDRKAMGNWPAAFGPDGTLFVQHDASGQLSHYDRTGAFIGSVAAEYASEGCFAVVE